MQLPLAPEVTEGIFMGYRFNSEGEWKCNYEVLDLDILRDLDLKCDA